MFFCYHLRISLGVFFILGEVKEVLVMGSVILEAQELTKEYRHAIALDHINLQI